MEEKNYQNKESEENIFIDKQKINITQNGETRLVDALHIGWANKRTFIIYFPPPVPQDFLNGIEDDEYISMSELWMETARAYLKDLKFLLVLPYNQFWSQVVYHKTVHDMLVSYLQHAPRSFTINFEKSISEESKQLRSQIHRFIFMVYLRMATHKESKKCKITPGVYGNLIYDNFIFDIPKIMDLCAIYGRANKDLLKKMVENVFQNQRGYFDDLKFAVEYINKTLTTIEEQFGLKHSDSDSNPNNNNKKNVERLDELGSVNLQDLVSYTLDTFGTIYSFLEIYPKACEVFLNEGFPLKMASLYDSLVINVVPELKRRIREDDVDMEPKLYEFNVMRTFMLKIFLIITDTCFIQPTLEKSSSSSSNVFDSFLTIISSLLSERRFILDYDSFHSFQDDFDLFVQAGYKSDTERVDYVTEGLQSILYESGRQLTKPTSMNGLQLLNDKMGDLSLNSENYPLLEAAAAASETVSGVELSSFISQVKDLLPDLGDGFIEICLEHYNYDVEGVINAILEDSLPSNLSCLDRDIKRVENVKPVPSSTNDYQLNPLIEQRKNIFDNDEFDIFRRDNIDLSKIHRGKRNKLDSVSNTDFKDITLKLLEESLNPDVSTIYDDEYDDTYDEQAINANESVTMDEMLERPFELPRVLGGRSRKFSPESSEESSEEENVVKRDEFVQNPAELRERAEQRRQENMNRNGHHNRNVRGGPKGQGQSDNVLRNRASKEKHKSSVSNHNRRQMADKKRSRGMFPV